VLVGVAEEQYKKRAFLPSFPFLTQPLCSRIQSLFVTLSSPCPRLVLALVLSLPRPVFSCLSSPHPAPALLDPRPAPSQLTHCSYSYALHGFIVLAVSVTPGVLLSRSSHTPCMGLLSSRYLSCLACYRRGILTRLAWARSPPGIHHARSALVALFSHVLRGLIFLAVSFTPGVLSSQSSDTPCVGSLLVSELVVAAPVHG